MENLAEEEIYKEFYPKIITILHHNSGVKSEDYADIVNETIKRTIENLRKGGFKGKAKLATFIHSICKRVIYNYLYQQKRDDKIREKAMLMTSSMPVINRSPNAIEKIYSNELHEILSRYIDELKDLEKKVIILFYYKGLKVNEIADLLNIDEQKVSNTKFYSLKKLRQMIGKKNLDEYLI